MKQGELWQPCIKGAQMKVLWGHSRKRLVLEGGLSGNLAKETGIEAELERPEGAVKAHAVSRERPRRTTLPTWPLVSLEDIRVWSLCVCHWVRPRCWRKRRYFKFSPHLYQLHSYWTCPKLTCHHLKLLSLWAFPWEVKAPLSLGWAPTPG